MTVFELMFPVYLHAGPVRLHPHAVFEWLGYFVGFRVYLALRRREGDVIGGHDRWSVIAAAVTGAAVGSKLLYWLEDPALTWAHRSDWSYLLAGKTIVGALVGGLLAVEITKRFAGIRTATGDLFAVPFAIGTAIGRIGCFLTGLPDQTYGTATTLPWAVDFGDGVARHPTQVYEALFMAALAAWLHWLAPRHRAGDRFKFLMVAYMAFRLVVDAVKPEPEIVAGLSSIQLAAAATLAYYAALFGSRYRPPVAALDD